MRGITHVTIDRERNKIKTNTSKFSLPSIYWEYSLLITMYICVCTRVSVHARTHPLHHVFHVQPPSSESLQTSECGFDLLGKFLSLMARRWICNVKGARDIQFNGIFYTSPLVHPTSDHNRRWDYQFVGQQTVFPRYVEYHRLTPFHSSRLWGGWIGHGR